ncbi:hypothetical protein [Clostridium botulinum]|uniref:hypothetical protein n=1 Tax=Clostridium botulinum TaxID=1491 RepID=UPI001C9AE18A|nr:hypothetical protein [Clostridium botulinum]MBY6898081.1 hypothetical protein [Clostridium botulinum]MBY6912394.1 hypothetical protein [Clostridium botulinum]
MTNIRNLIDSKLIDVEININGFTVLYFEDKKGNVCSVDLCPTIRKLEKGTAQEVPVQEQSININISNPLSVIPQKVNSKMKNLVFDL